MTFIEKQFQNYRPQPVILGEPSSEGEGRGSSFSDKLLFWILFPRTLRFSPRMTKSVLSVNTYRNQLLTILFLTCVASPLNAAQLKPEVKVSRDVITLGDLVEGISLEQAQTPLFRAPQVGETGTIQTARIIESTQKLGIALFDTGGLTQVSVMREARRIVAPDFEKVLALTLAEKHGFDTRTVSIIFDGTPPAFVLPTEIDGQVKVEEMSYDPRARRISANISVATSTGTQRRTQRMAGQVVEMAQVAVLNRTLNRGDALQASDISFERRLRETVPPDAMQDMQQLAGYVAKRSLAVGTALKSSDLTKPDVVGRGENVTLIFEAKGMMLTARGKALEAGGVGTVINVQNLQSKRTLQATIVGAGKATVSAFSASAITASLPTSSNPSSRTANSGSSYPLSTGSLPRQ
jgi:flagellar basal body P-ring formation protein FlgA